MYKLIVFSALILTVALAATHFDDGFGNGWEDRWVSSTFKGADAGRWEAVDGGLKTTEDYRFYQLSAGFDSFSNKGKTLVLQYSVRFDQKVSCGGSYIKLLPSGLDQDQFNGDSDYNIMFGPDICGTGTRKVHVIFNYKGENHLINHNIPCETDQVSHVYTLIVKPDQTYQVLIDNEEQRTGSLLEDWDFLPPKMINDPSVSKPGDWVDDPMMVDSSAVKPDGWDDIPEFIQDPDASIPDDWDTELDGDWEAPVVPNPEFMGEWEAPMIPNPDYQGPWVHPQVENPDYSEDSEIYAFASHAFVGFELWQVDAGTVFGDILVTDDVELASTRADAVVARQAAEIAAKEAEEAARLAREEEERARLEEELDLDDDAADDHVHDEL